MKNQPYHYTLCGLDNVWLRNGFEYSETPYGKGVSIQDVEGLHKAIALALTEKPTPLKGTEFRFLRKELEMSQKRLGELLRRDAQTVANWEKSDEIKSEADFLIRHIYKQHSGGRQSYVELVEHLNQLDREEYFNLEFGRGKGGWRKAS